MVDLGCPVALHEFLRSAAARRLARSAAAARSTCDVRRVAPSVVDARGRADWRRDWAAAGLVAATDGGVSAEHELRCVVCGDESALSPAEETVEPSVEESCTAT